MSEAETRSCQCSKMRGIPNSRATVLDDAGRRLQTAEISTSSSARRPGMGLERVLAPAPIKPTRRGFEAMRASAKKCRGPSSVTARRGGKVVLLFVSFTRGGGRRQRRDTGKTRDRREGDGR